MKHCRFLQVISLLKISQGRDTPTLLQATLSTIACRAGTRLGSGTEETGDPEPTLMPTERAAIALHKL